MNNSLLTTLKVCIAIFTAITCTAKEFEIYPAPDGIELSDAYKVFVEGDPVPVYKTKIPSDGPIPRLTGSRSEYGMASLASFDIAESVRIEVKCPTAVDSVKILPTSYKIKAQIEGNKVTFSIDKPSHITVEINGNWHESLHISANPPEKNIPDPNSPNVIYFEPGIHEITSMEIESNTTVYVAGGAYLKCMMVPGEEEIEIGQKKMHRPTFILKGENIQFRGRGIIDGSLVYPRKNRRYMVLINDCKNVTLEGISFLDPSRWTIPIKRSNTVHVDNIKIIGWRGNSDGVDISSSQNVLVENCFMRTLDDLVVVKSRTGQGVSKNIHVRKCVLWNELAHALSIGAEIREDISDVLFEDCDVIHDVGRETALRVYHCDSAVVSNITFQNIRVEEGRRLISCWIGKTRWTKTNERGHINNVVFRNITTTSAPIDPSLTGFQDGSDWKPYSIKDHASVELIGYDDTHLIENILFDNVIIDEKKIELKNITTNEYVKNVRFK